MKGAISQYALAALAIIAMVVVNIWGKESEALTTALVGVITAALWGGVQRQRGIQVGREESNDNNS